jgi:hypothetical protein
VTKREVSKTGTVQTVKNDRTVVTTIDTLKILSQAKIRFQIEAEKTKRAYGDSLFKAVYNSANLTALIDSLKVGRFSTPTLHAENKWSRAEAGIYNNVPFLNLYAKALDTVIKVPYDMNQVNKVTVEKLSTDTKLTKDASKETVIEEPWYMEKWFWAFSALLALNILYIAFRLSKWYASKSLPLPGLS